MRDSLLDDPATDPALAAVLADMYRRWPEIAREADHPITDFYARRRNPRIWNSYVALLLMLVGPAILVALYFQLVTITPEWFAKGLTYGLGFIIFHRVFGGWPLKSKKPRSAVAFARLILYTDDPHVHLLPVRASRLLASHIALDLIRRSSPRRIILRRAMILLFALSLALFFIAFLAWPPFSLFHLLESLAFLALVATASWAIGDANDAAIRSITAFMRALSEQTRWSTPGNQMRLMTILVAFVSLPGALIANIMLVVAYYETPPAIRTGVLLLVATLLLLFAFMIWRESRVPVEKLEDFYYRMADSMEAIQRSQ